MLPYNFALEHRAYGMFEIPLLDTIMQGHHFETHDVGSMCAAWFRMHIVA